MLNKKHTVFVLLLLPMLLAPAGEGFAQVWHHKRENSIRSSQSESASPVSLYYNPTASWNAASISGTYENGDFHRVDKPAGKRELDLSAGELGSFGTFRTEGSLRYRNTRDLGRNWNSLIGNDPDNPYIICDTLSDHSTTERFDMEGALTWHFHKQWVAAGKIGLTTATLTDTKDPRPKNDISRIPVLLGLEHHFAGSWSAGVYGGAELFFSKFTNYLEYGQKAYRYYKMKGMGDFFAFSSSESSSAPREYAGATFSGGLNLGYRNAAVENFTEAGVETGYENARDGGSAYEWKAGDYRFTRIHFLERLDLKGELRHSFGLNAALKLTEGYWYDQKQMIDTDHGNISYYEVMSRYQNNRGTRLTAGLDYAAGKEKSWNAALHLSLLHESRTHYADGEPCTQRWSQLGIRADGWKTFPLGQNLLDISAGAGYVLPLGEALFASGNTAPARDDITDAYVAPIFAYETAGKLSAHLRADWVFAAAKQYAPGIFVKGTLLKQASGPASYYGISAGAFLKF